MLNTIYAALVFGIFLIILVWSGLIKTVKIHLDQDPAQNAYQSEAVQQTQSEKVIDLQEKNRQLMDRVRSQMERNRH